MTSGEVSVQSTENPKCVHVKEIRRSALQVEEKEEDEGLTKSLEQLSRAFGDANAEDADEADNTPDGIVTDVDGAVMVTCAGDEVANSKLQACKEGIEEDDIPAKERDLETKAVKWSLRRAHRKGIPEQGWIVDLDRRVCGCKYFGKMLSCAHIIVAERTRGLNGSRHDPAAKLKNRIQRTKLGEKAQGKTKKKPAKSRLAPSLASRALAERPPRASSALDVQFILN
ncbi:hypothetical protein PHYSODRAFT_295417 [Phytophthora sojae]|uniref:SWIM-type domain-containing protein n=1 Tax=Phytophthora sojae (strain P6497) TaxID=1094619 RepID=G4YR55_PHYSP|nr:hypothetical protein PHYSODRAFT_295417 [Phytophthora sojae]EGZ30735.1 hypothetical protein PHYSODRAFT_295417 [Phytophthora sojae]|eukprot:XP_009518010.1 hypothetical protein PHYSODRAFT_295417 [Phytophthora sojae]